MAREPVPPHRSDLHVTVPFRVMPLSAPDPRPTVAQLYSEAIVYVAQQYVGTREIGVNAGPVVERMLRFVGLRRGQPWCAAAVATILHEAAANLGLVSTCPTGLLAASATKLWRFALRNPELAMAITDPLEIRPGDVGVMTSDARRARDVRERGSLSRGHTWVCTSGPLDELGAHGSAEGNTSPQGERDGQGFCVRRRPGYGDPRFVGVVRFGARAKAA